jgi:hypothetical protein
MVMMVLMEMLMERPPPTPRKSGDPAEKLASKWQGPLVVQEVYRSGAIHLRGDYKCRPHVVNAQCFKHYIAC